MIYCKVSCYQTDRLEVMAQARGLVRRRKGIAQRPNTYLLGHLGRLAFLCFLRITIFLAYCSSSHRRTRREVNSKAVMYILGLAPFRMSDVGRKEVDILRLGLEGILLEAVAFWLIFGKLLPHKIFVRKMQTAQTF